MQPLTQLADSQSGRGPYGVDADYFHRQLPRIILGLENFRPAELAREFARMAISADAAAARDELLPATKHSGNSRDEVLCMAAQMALDYIARIHGAPARDDLELESAYVTLSLMRALDPYMSAAGKDRNRQTHETICALYNAGRCIDLQQPAPAMTQVELDVIANLVELTRFVTLAMDDSEEEGRVHLIDSDNFDFISAQLDGLDELPDDKPGYTLGPAGKAEWALRRLLAAAPQLAQPQQPAVIEEIAAERRRQIEVEGWTPEHDDQHTGGQLADAASCYARLGAGWSIGASHRWWPFDSPRLNPGTRRQNLVKAGALIVAELERIDRAAAPQPKEGSSHD
ncbi:hypothetical protein [Chromobacterium vaccinii]|uniref:Uncharacterized protein n=1 Tax=Chromobacterium vaccinii TaxID=1108595 RepID=A0A1D9LC85_9NEIS|nr:hypothetical protein [Chromobacterium vaccinii]AOZ48794.1 hypothetical protein BKX93_01475 [Chromobacterium vaccinii]